MNSIKNYSVDFENLTLSFTVNGEPDDSFDDFCDPTDFCFGEGEFVTIDGQEYATVSITSPDAPGRIVLTNEDGEPLTLTYLQFCQRVECF